METLHHTLATSVVSGTEGLQGVLQQFMQHLQTLMSQCTEVNDISQSLGTLDSMGPTWQGIINVTSLNLQV